MIITKISSGLGNQLFQYATARAISARSNAKLKLDISYYDHNNDRKYRLNQYNIIENLATKDEVEAHRTEQMEKKNLIKNILNRFDPSGIEFLSKTHIREKPLVNFEPRVLRLKDDIYLEGYWQNQLYFESIRNILLKEFTLKESLNNQCCELVNKVKSCNSVSVHVRRSDYVNNEFFISLSRDYYRNACSLINRKVEDPVYFVTSDDINWAKSSLNLKGNIFIVDLDGEEKDILDFEVMRNCRHNIIANSTYSWWGAWLNQTQGKNIIAPKRWSNNYTFQKNQDKKEFIPAEWIRL